MTLTSRQCVLRDHTFEPRTFIPIGVAVASRLLLIYTIMVRHLRFSIVVAISVTTLCGQNLSIGVIGGASPTADFQNQRAGGDFPFINYSTPKRYAIGATLEYRFLSQIAVEADGIFHPLGYTFAGIEPGGSLNSVSPATVVTWEFPVLAKYRFTLSGVRPFLEAGPSFRTTENLNSANPSHYGFTGGVGIETRWRSVNLAPVIRYTRWAPDRHVADVKTVPDQIEVGVGLSSRSPSSDWHPLGGSVSLGAVVGVSLTADFRSRTQQYMTSDSSSVETFQGSGPRSFLSGAMLEVALPRRFSLEGNVIYDPLNSTSRTVILGTPPVPSLLPSSYGYASPEWKFPALAKYRFPGERLKPLVELYGVTAGLGFETRMRRRRSRRCSVTPAGGRRNSRSLHMEFGTNWNF
jgi:hypothetical protein